MSKLEQFRKDCRKKLRLNSKIKIPEPILKKESFIDLLPFDDGTFEVIDLKQFDSPIDGSKQSPYFGVQGKKS